MSPSVSPEWIERVNSFDRDFVDVTLRIPKWLANALEPMRRYFNDPRAESCEAHGAFAISYAMHDCNQPSFAVSIALPLGSTSGDLHTCLHQQQHILSASKIVSAVTHDQASVISEIFSGDDKTTLYGLAYFYNNFEYGEGTIMPSLNFNPLDQ